MKIPFLSQSLQFDHFRAIERSAGDGNLTPSTRHG